MRYVTDAFAYARAGASVEARTNTAIHLAMRDFAEYSKYTQAEEMDIDAILRLSITCAWVYSGIKLIADRASSSDARFVVKRRIGEETRDIKNHPFEILLQRPNSLMTMEYIQAYTVFFLFLTGNAYWFVSTPLPAQGEPQEIWPIPATMVIPLPETIRKSRLTGGLCIDYEYTIAGKKHKLPGENVVHFRMPNPFDYWRGLSPLTAGLQGIRTDNAQGKFIFSKYSKDNAIPTAIISLPPETSPADFEIAKQQIRDQFGTGQRSAITRAGDLTVQTIQMTMDQLQGIETRKFSREEINYVLGVPNDMMGGGISGDGRLATEITFTRNTVQPLLNAMAAELTANIALYYGRNIIIAAPSIIPQDRSLLIQEYSMYSQDRSVNENRRVLGLPPVDLFEKVEPLIAKYEELTGMPPDMESLASKITSIALMLNLPTRLLAYIQSNTFTSSMPPAYSNIEQPEQVGDITDSINPEHFVNENAVRMGMLSELNRWKKVALKEARDGRNPADRVFDTQVLPDDRVESIRSLLNGTDLDTIRMIFDKEIHDVNQFGFEGPQYQRNGNGVHD